MQNRHPVLMVGHYVFMRAFWQDKGNGFKLKEGRFRLSGRKILRVMKHWHRMPRELWVPHPWSEGQVGWDPGSLIWCEVSLCVAGVANGWTSRSFPTQAIMLFCDAMITQKHSKGPGRPSTQFHTGLGWRLHGGWANPGLPSAWACCWILFRSYCKCWNVTCRPLFFFFFLTSLHHVFFHLLFVFFLHPCH